MTDTHAEHVTAFAELTVPLLRARAASAGIIGRSKMNKTELVAALADFEVAQQRGADVERMNDVRTSGHTPPSAIITDAIAAERGVPAPGRLGHDVPAQLCSHGIDASRPGLCSICAEDAELGAIKETDGRCSFGNIHAIETCRGCGTEDDQGNQITPVVETHTAPQAARPVTLMCAKSFIGANGGAGICSVRQEPGARGNHEGPHFDDQRRLWSGWTPRDAFKKKYSDLLVFVSLLADQLEGSGDNALAADVRKFVRESNTGAAVGSDSDYARELAEALIAVQKQRHELRCALAHLVGCWGVDAADKPYAAKLDSVLKEHR